MGAAAGDAGEAERGAGERKSSNRLGKKQGREERSSSSFMVQKRGKEAEEVGIRGQQQEGKGSSRDVERSSRSAQEEEQEQ